MYENDLRHRFYKRSQKGTELQTGFLVETTVNLLFKRSKNYVKIDQLDSFSHNFIQSGILLVTLSQ